MRTVRALFRIFGAFFVVALGAGAAACEERTARLRPAETRAAATPRHELEPLAGEWIQTLVDDRGRRVGMVTVPLGAREPRPMVVAVHGAQSRPDWMCGATRSSVGPWPFVICPHPVEDPTVMASWSDGSSLRAALERAVAAAALRFGPHLLREEAMYLGHSQGAMAAPYALGAGGHDRTVFSYGLFFEGVPHDPGGAAAEISRSKMARVLLVSGQDGWATSHAQYAKSLKARAVDARHVHAGGGHFFAPVSVATMRSQLWWLVRDAPGWHVER